MANDGQNKSFMPDDFMLVAKTLSKVAVAQQIIQVVNGTMRVGEDCQTIGDLIAAMELEELCGSADEYFAAAQIAVTLVQMVLDTVTGVVVSEESREDLEDLVEQAERTREQMLEVRDALEQRRTAYADLIRSRS